MRFFVLVAGCAALSLASPTALALPPTCTVAADCADNGVFCDGLPRCVGGFCTGGVLENPCGALSCDEGADQCVATFPGLAPCNTTLQSCIDGVPNRTRLEIATDGPISGGVTFDKDLELRAAAGFAPRFTGTSVLWAFLTDDGNPHQVVFRGLTLASGYFRLNYGGTAQTRFQVLDCVTESAFNFPSVWILGGGNLSLEVTGNDFTVGDAGGVGPTSSPAQDWDADIRNNTFRMAPGSGAAVTLFNIEDANATFAVRGNIILGAGFEEGIAITQDGAGTTVAEVSNNLVSGQTGSAGGASAISGRASTGTLDLELINNTVVGNLRGVFVTGSAGGAAQGLLANNLVAYNTGTGLGIDPPAGSTLANRYNLVFGNGFDDYTAGPGTVLQDPMLIGGTNPTQAPGFEPAPYSPAIDSGDDTAVPAGTLQDVLGGPRFRGGSVDIGAIEAVPEPGAAGCAMAAFAGLCFARRRRPAR